MSALEQAALNKINEQLAKISERNLSPDRKDMQAFSLLMQNEIQALMKADPGVQEKLKQANEDKQLFAAFEALQQELQQKLNASTEHESNPVESEVVASGDDRKAILEAYNKMLKAKGYNKDDYPPIDVNTTDNPVKVRFRTEQDAKDFFKQMAEEKKVFTYLDKNHKLIAYSDGSGTLKSPDGKPFDFSKPLRAQADAPTRDFTKPILEDINAYQERLRESTQEASSVELGVPSGSSAPDPTLSSPSR